MRREDKPLQKYTINLYRGDLERVQELFPATGASRIIREAVRKLILRTEEAVKAKHMRLADDEPV